MDLTLPEPGEYEQMHSSKLCELIASEIKDSGGVISFRRYMEMALYQPGLGYYMAGARKFGAEGDFVTAPETSPLFSDCLAAQCQQVLDQIKTPASVLEFGAGSGRMAADILARLEQLNCLPNDYYILELSAELKKRQQKTLEHDVPHLAGRVKWLSSLDGLEFRGIVIANEVLDAMPVRRFRQDDTGLTELGVQFKNDQFSWRSFAADTSLEHQVSQIRNTRLSDWQEPYESELNPAIDSWIASIASILTEGAVLFIDYGYVQQEYYHPERRQGTLIGHYQHRAIDDPFIYPGLQDLSASVDFSAVAHSGEKAGLELSGFTSQALFLMGVGLDKFYTERINEDQKGQLALAQQVKLLTLPSEMGERFQVIGFTKSIESPLSGFAIRNQIYRL